MGGEANLSTVTAITYADVVGTVALFLALCGLLWNLYVHHTEAKHRVRVEEEVERHQAKTAFLPRLRSSVLSAMQFIDEPGQPDGWRRPNVLVGKCKARFQRLDKDWMEQGHLVSEQTVRDAVNRLGLADEIAWLDSLSSPEADIEGLHSRLLRAKARLQEVVDAIDAL